MVWLSDEMVHRIVHDVHEGFINAELYIHIRDSSNSRMHRMGIANRERTMTSRQVITAVAERGIRAQLVTLEDSVYNMHYVYDAMECSGVLVLRKPEDVTLDLESFIVT